MFDFSDDDFSTLSIRDPPHGGGQRDGRTNPLASIFDRGSEKRKLDQTEETCKRSRATCFGPRTEYAFVSPPSAPCSPPYSGLAKGLLPISPLLLSEAAPDAHRPSCKSVVMLKNDSRGPRALSPCPF